MLSLRMEYEEEDGYDAEMILWVQGNPVMSYFEVGQAMGVNSRLIELMNWIPVPR